MIPFLARLLSRNESLSFLRVGDYISVRAAGALMLAFLISILFGERTIAFLRRLKAGQYIRDDKGADAISLKEMHAQKVGTPTMGGLLMLGSLLAAAILFGDWTQPLFRLAVAMAVGFAAIGFIDDYRKVVKKNSAGLSARGKLLGQMILGLSFGAACAYSYGDLFTYSHADVNAARTVFMPFVKDWYVPLGVLFLPFCALVLMATSNAVNLTDGLDGLAAGVTVSATICFGLVAYCAGRPDLATYLIIPHVEGASELSVLMAALIGCCFGFLWFNGFPAKVFMGDTGSMMIGGLLGAVALLLKQEFLLLIVGGIFVAEACSVIIQVTSYKLRKKRVFLMSPLHHHFERAGVVESHIILRFWIVSALLALAGLSTLKIR